MEGVSRTLRQQSPPRPMTTVEVGFVPCLLQPRTKGRSTAWFIVPTWCKTLSSGSTLSSIPLPPLQHTCQDAMGLVSQAQLHCWDSSHELVPGFLVNLHTRKKQHPRLLLRKRHLAAWL